MRMRMHVLRAKISIVTVLQNVIQQRFIAAVIDRQSKKVMCQCHDRASDDFVPCSSSSAIIEYPALDSQMSASQNSHFPSSLELFSQNGSSCSAPLPTAHLTNGSLSKPTSDLIGHGHVKVPI